MPFPFLFTLRQLYSYFSTSGFGFPHFEFCSSKVSPKVLFTPMSKGKGGGADPPPPPSPAKLGQMARFRFKHLVKNFLWWEQSQLLGVREFSSFFSVYGHPMGESGCFEVPPPQSPSFNLLFSDWIFLFYGCILPQFRN